MELLPETLFSTYREAVASIVPDVRPTHWVGIVQLTWNAEEADLIREVGHITFSESDQKWVVTHCRQFFRILKKTATLLDAQARIAQMPRLHGGHKEEQPRTIETVFMATDDQFMSVCLVKK